MVIQYQAGRVHRALCLEPVGSEGIPGTASGRSSIVQTSPAKYNPFPRSALSLNTKFVNNFFLQPKIKLSLQPKTKNVAASDKFGLYSECCERFLAPSTSPTFSRGERHPTSIRWASSCGSHAVLMCRMTRGCKCRQAGNYELQSCALRPQSGPPPPRKKRLSAMRCSALPGRRLYKRLLGWRLKLLVTHWPPTPRSGARADATTVPATATESEWRSRPSAYYQLEMWR